MACKNKNYFIILGLVGQLSIFGPLPTETLQASDKALRQETFLAAPLPEKGRLTLVAFFPVIVEGQIVGAAAVYDDVSTERPADYLELYNTRGDLLALSWFDRFGIQRTVVDRGLVEEADELEGVFVLLLEGSSI